MRKFWMLNKPHSDAHVERLHSELHEDISDMECNHLTKSYVSTFYLYLTLRGRNKVAYICDVRSDYLERPLLCNSVVSASIVQFGPCMVGAHNAPKIQQKMSATKLPYWFFILQNVYIFDFYSFLYFYIEKVIYCFEVLFDFDVLIALERLFKI